MGAALFMAALCQPWKESALAGWISSLQTLAPRGSEGSQQLLTLLGSYHGYLWSRWFKSLLLSMWPLGGVAMGMTLAAASCPWIKGRPGPSGAGLFTFSLPVS